MFIVLPTAPICPSAGATTRDLLKESLKIKQVPHQVRDDILFGVLSKKQINAERNSCFFVLPYSFFLFF